MKSIFEIQRTTRANVLKACSDLKLEKMNAIPAGFNNSIAWNLGHILITQKLLVYGLSGNNLNLDSKLVELYRKGSTPETPVTQKDLDKLKAMFLSTVDQCEVDFNNGLFSQFKTYPTSYNYTLKTVEDAILFNNSHEALHFGYIMAMKKYLI